MTDIAADLIAKLTAAFPTYVEERVRQLGLTSPAGLAGALEQGEAWLRASLEALLALPFDEQRRGPLEVFQEAMRFPTEALVTGGVEPVTRDAGTKAALPGDVYDLAPPSSRLIGDEAWAAHLAWGAAKAAALGRSRRVGLISVNLMDRTTIEPRVARSGSQLVVWDGRAGDPSLFGGVPLDLALVDLALPEAVPVVARLAEAGVRVIAFGPHVDRDLLRRARGAGADVVLARSAFFAKLDDLLV
jgi:hypothetical protein